jgi:hypothetical protein
MTPSQTWHKCPKFVSIDTETLNKMYLILIILHTVKLGDNFIVFENFMASIGDLMVTN